MGKLIGAIVRFVFMVGLLGFVGYNAWETAQLRREVAALRQQSVGVAVKGKTSISAKIGIEKGSDPVSLLTSARRHYDAAQEHLGRREYADASREMLLATEAAKKASRNAGALSGDRVREFQQAVQSLSSRAGELLDQGENNGSSKPKK